MVQTQLNRQFQTKFEKKKYFNLIKEKVIEFYLNDSFKNEIKNNVRIE